MAKELYLFKHEGTQFSVSVREDESTQLICGGDPDRWSYSTLWQAIEDWPATVLVLDFQHVQYVDQFSMSKLIEAKERADKENTRIQIDFRFNHDLRNFFLEHAPDPVKTMIKD